MTDALSFGAWCALSDEGVVAASDGPAAVQLRRRDGLVAYPSGKSAMVFYFFAPVSARASLVKHFADELARPGARGQGELLFRTAPCDDGGAALARLFDEFVARFGRAPVLHDGEPA